MKTLIWILNGKFYELRISNSESPKENLKKIWRKFVQRTKISCKNSLYLKIYIYLWTFFCPSLREKCQNAEFFLDRIFPNTGKYGPEKTPYFNTFHAVPFFDIWRVHIISSGIFRDFTSNLISQPHIKKKIIVAYLLFRSVTYKFDRFGIWLLFTVFKINTDAYKHNSAYHIWKAITIKKSYTT